MRCTVCNHHLVADIDLAILSGDYTLDQLSQTFGPSRSAFFRHSRHLKEKMSRCLKRLDNQRHQISFLKLSAVLDHVQQGIETSAADGHIDRVFRGSHIAGRLIHQLNNMDLPLEPDTAYRLLLTPGQASRDSILPHGPDTIADLHQALVNQTLAPCPPLADDDEDETAAPPPEDQPAPAKTTLPLPAAPWSKHRRRQAARRARHQLRLNLRRQKYLLNGKTSSPNPVSLFPDPCLLKTQNPKPEILFSNHWPLTPDHYPSAPANVANVRRESEAHPAVPDNLIPLAQASAPKASPPATAPENNRDKSATKPKHQRRQLIKMLRHQRHSLKSKKLRQNFVSGRPNPAPPESQNPEPETPFPNPSSLIPDPCPPEIPDPCPSDETAPRAAEPCEIDHGPKPRNPPKNIPNRRRYDGYPSSSIFGDIKNVLKYM